VEDLVAAVEEFQAQAGCYPGELSDLTATHVTEGRDASGNPVPLDLTLAQPLLSEIPVDPSTGRRDTWVYDVLSPTLVDPGGWRCTLTTSGDLFF
jgi:hypothetical protein